MMDPPVSQTDQPRRAPAKNMVWVPGGELLMGSEQFYPEERPVRRVSVDGFWIDEHPVTVADFERFVLVTDSLVEARQFIEKFVP